MFKLPEDLLEAFAKYEDIQKNQIACFDKGIDPEIEKFTDERSRAFEELRNELTCMLKKTRRGDDNALELALACHARLTSLLAKDDLLSIRMLEYREKLSECVRNKN